LIKQLAKTINMKKVLSKKNFFTLALLLFAGSLLFAFEMPENSLIGRWFTLNPDGSPVQEYVDFANDGTYDVVLPNGDIGERGFYELKDSLFSIKNAKDVCGKGYWGKYNLTFHGSDSIHLSLIEDSCSARRMDMVGYNPGLKRYKTK
jgi:hypothetical protein